MDDKTLHTSFAKITRPHYADVLPRERLFELLDDRRYPVVWVSAPPGAGKTALISSYLAARRLPHLWYQLDHGDGDLPTFFHYLGLAAGNAARPNREALPHMTAEYVRGVAAFARRYFESLAARVKPPFVLVFDNYHEVPTDAALHAVLRDAIAALPPGFSIVVLSRSDPPAEMARIRVNDQLRLMGWDELRFTLEEVRSIERLIRGDNVRIGSHEELYDKTQGWAGGLVLMLQQGRQQGLGPIKGATHQVLFDYFAGEVFANLEVETQHVLMASALLRKMTARSVAELTGFTGAGELLRGLNRGNYFTLEHDHVEPVYEYHPLFREFLLARAEQMLEQGKLRRLRTEAAALLERNEHLQRMEARLDGCGLMEKGVYYYGFAWLRATQGDLKSARELASMSLTMVEDAAAPFFATVVRNHLGTLLVRTGERAAGLALIHQACAEARAMQSPTMEYLTALAQAALAMDAGDEAACVEHLRCGLAAGANRLYNNRAPQCTMACRNVHHLSAIGESLVEDRRVDLRFPMESAERRSCRRRPFSWFAFTAYRRSARLANAAVH